MGDGKSERCLMLAELELDTCWDRHPCSSPSAMTSSVIAPPPCDNKGGSTETRPTPALYSDGDVLMDNVDDSVTDDLYQ